MHIKISSRLSTILGRTAAVTFLAAAGTLGLSAQQSSGTATAMPEFDLKGSLAAPAALSSSSSNDMVYVSPLGETAKAEPLSFGGAEQPPPRRRYGRPNYSDRHTNADGSSKWAFEVGGGFTLPTGGTHNYFTTSYDFQVGAGRNFNKKFGTMVDFNWANFGMQSNTLNNQLNLYNNLPCDPTQFDCSPIPQLGGHGHVWSFSLDPIYNFYQSDKLGAYVTGGVGFYHKTATFTTPSVGTYCDYYGFCYQYQANTPIDSYTSNAAGFNGGLGLTYKFSRFSNVRFFVEGKYIYTANSRRAETGTTAANTPANSTAFNAFPQNSAPTTFIPIIFGLRF